MGTPGGDIGHVKDFYFDDKAWAVRYVVVDTGAWLAGRLVLISPHAFGNFYQDEDCLLVELTRSQIEHSPSIDSHKPISRQFEEEYFKYYGWPNYWGGLELWGGAGFPVAPPPPGGPMAVEDTPGDSSDNNDPHLRSTKSVNGYHIHTRDGSLGKVTDFMIDDKTWAVRHLVVETGHWFSGKEVIISPRDIVRISFEESTVFVNVTKAAVRDALEYHMPRAQYRDARQFADTEA